MESVQNLETFDTHEFFFEFWSKNELILVHFWGYFGQKKGVQNFFSRRFGGEIFFRDLCLGNLAAANAAVTTKLAENEVPLQGFVSEAYIRPGSLPVQGPQLARTPNPGALCREPATGDRPLLVL